MPSDRNQSAKSGRSRLKTSSEIQAMDARSLRSLSTTLTNHLECPICYKPCHPPIYTCLNGHNVCAGCQPHLSTCPICRCSKPVGRNLFAEALSTQLHPPPSFTCWARSNDAVDCSWRGPGAALLAHVAANHPRRITHGDSIKVDWKYKQGELTHRISLAATHDALFWVVLCVWPENSCVFVTVRRVVSVGDDAGFRFRVGFASPDGEQTLSFESRVAELEERGGETRRALRLHTDVLGAFAEGGRLCCEVKIERIV